MPKAEERLMAHGKMVRLEHGDREAMEEAGVGGLGPGQSLGSHVPEARLVPGVGVGGNWEPARLHVGDRTVSELQAGHLGQDR